MPTRDQIFARKKEAAAQVSTQTRTLAFGFLAIAWALLTAHDEPLKSMAGHVPPWLILLLAVTSVTVLTFDMLQYVGTVWMTDSALDKAGNAEPTKDIDYGASLANKAHVFFYWAKFWVLGAGALLVIVIFILLFLPVLAQSK